MDRAPLAPTVLYVGPLLDTDLTKSGIGYVRETLRAKRGLFKVRQLWARAFADVL